METAARAWRDGEPPARLGTSPLRLASWRAGRSRPDGPLLHPGTMRETPAAEVVDAPHQHVREALVDHGDDERVREGIARLHEQGNGARVQRQLLRSGGDLAQAVTRCALLTTSRRRRSPGRKLGMR